jgi:hypothetical protein
MVMISSRPLKPKIQIHYGEKFRSTQSAVKDGQLKYVRKQNAQMYLNVGILALLL